MYKKLALADELPASVPTVHPKRDRKNYSVDKSLQELGIDGSAFNQKLQDYMEWSEALETKVKQE